MTQTKPRDAAEFEDDEDDLEEEDASSAKDGSSKDFRVRRRSRRRRTQARLTPVQQRVHYGMMVVFIFGLLFAVLGGGLRVKIEHAVREAIPALKDIPMFRLEFVAMAIAAAIWLYMTPGVEEKVKEFLGLQKQRRHSHRRVSRD